MHLPLGGLHLLPARSSGLNKQSSVEAASSRDGLSPGELRSRNGGTPAVVHLTQGRLYGLLGQFAAARRALLAAQKANPQSTEISRELDQLPPEDQ